MNPLNVPTEITDLADTCPYYLKPTIVPTILAHFWPAIEAHLREQIATEMYEQNPDRDADFSAGVDWAIDLVRRPAP